MKFVASDDHRLNVDQSINGSIKTHLYSARQMFDFFIDQLHT